MVKNEIEAKDKDQGKESLEEELAKRVLRAAMGYWVGVMASMRAYKSAI
jgi:hypothetical protein